MGPLGLLPELGAASWVLLGLGAAIVGVSKTALPGAATVAVGLFALVLPAKESTAALLLLLLVGDAMALWVYRRDPDVATLLRLLPSVLVGIGTGALFFLLVDGAVVQKVIGAVLLALVLLTLLQRRRAGEHEDGPGDDPAPPSGGLVRASEHWAVSRPWSPMPAARSCPCTSWPCGCRS